MFKSNRREIQAYRKRYEDGIFGGPFAPIFKFDLSAVTFTPSMDKRTSPGPFATAPICQGKWDGTGQPDTVLINNSNSVHNYFNAYYDAYQGSVSLWITPEWNGNDGKEHRIFYDYGWGTPYLTKTAAGDLTFNSIGGSVIVDVSAWTAGTTYHVVARWDSRNPIDGTNYSCLSVNNVHTFGVASSFVVSRAFVQFSIGSTGFLGSADAIIEGLTVYRRVLFDGTNGVAANWDDSGPIDEIEAIYAAGAGQDPCLVTGSWDVVFCLPTNSTAEALVTGTGEAWSHPHSSGVLKHQWLEDGGYLGRPWAVLFDGADTTINCGSGATLDNIPDGGALTAEGWFRSDSVGEGGNGMFFAKGTIGFGGWKLIYLSSTSILIQMDYDTTDINEALTVPDMVDGKCHHIALTYDEGGDRKVRLYIDGHLEAVSAASAGNYVSDAGNDFRIGTDVNGNNSFDGVIGWVALSNNVRYTADFIPPRQPIATDGNHVEMWHLDEGTGALINAEVTSPANDGTLANGTWEEQWDIETTPIVPYSVEFDGSTTWINCGSGVTLDDLGNAKQFTAECWVRVDSNVTTQLLHKGNGTNTGWEVFILGSNTVRFRVRLGTTDASATCLTDIVDGKWHHIVVHYDDATKTAQIGIDGIWEASHTGAGAWQSDAVQNLVLGRRADTGAYYLDGAMGYARISDNARWTPGTDFTPPSRLNPPGADGNTVEQWNFRDGPGTTLVALVTTPANDGTISNGTWHITPDQEIDSPGERIYQWGYVLGNDAVDEGITQILSGLDAGENYVVRAVGTVEAASRGRNKLIVYDETNSAIITALEGPSYHGNHDGGAGAANLTDTTARFPQMLVGWTVYNITDGSSCVCTAISGDMQTITTPLAGGGANLWAISDEYRIVPPGGPSYYDDFPWAETFCFELPTIARNGAAADCVSISFKMVNGGNEGVLKWAQVELLENLVDNPSIETGAGNPWIPDGWTNYTYAAGEAAQDVAVFHSGASSLDVNAAVSRNMGVNTGGHSSDKYYAISAWMYSVALTIWWNDTSGTIMYFQHSLGIATRAALGAVWKEYGCVVRCVSGANYILLTRGSGVHHGNFDDLYIFALDDVSLTVTPASEANSLENGGLRVDGRDGAPQPIPAGMLGATGGHIKWKYTPRHDPADVMKFGVGVVVRPLYVYFDATRLIYLDWTVANNFRLQFNDGGGVHSAAWNPAILNADTEYLMEIKYNASQMILRVDGITRITITTPINFTAIPNIVHWGTHGNGTFQADAVFSAP